MVVASKKKSPRRKTKSKPQAIFVTARYGAGMFDLNCPKCGTRRSLLTHEMGEDFKCHGCGALITPQKSLDPMRDRDWY